MMKKSSLALVVPCYNESESIPFFEAELIEFVTVFSAKMPQFDLIIYVIDNNSIDNSFELLKRTQSKVLGMQVLKSKIQGYGASLKFGFEVAKSHNYIAFLDLDNTYPLVSLIDMVLIAELEETDIIYGARIHKSSSISFIRKIGNLSYVYLLKIFFRSSLSDVCSGMRLFKSAFVSDILKLKSNDLSFSIELTILALKKKWNIAEISINYRDRVGESKLLVARDGFLFLFIILKNIFKKEVNNV